MEAGHTNTATDDVYEVERILRKRSHPSKGVQYLVKWRDYPNSENTWEPPGNFPQKLIDDYLSKKGKKRNSKPSLRETPKPTSLDSALDDHPLPSSSTTTSITSSCSSSTTIITTTTSQVARKRGRPRKDSNIHRQQLAQLHIQQQQQQQHQRPELAEREKISGLVVFNPVNAPSKPVGDELVYDLELTKEPIIVTDVTAKDLTVTISECKIPEGFFKT